MVTYNKLLYSSMQLLTAVVNITMMQLLVKTRLVQSVLGISAVRFLFTR